jgi:hypothetical protein
VNAHDTISSRAADARPHVDADFAEEILAELYAYERKRPWVAWLLWFTLGLFGAHRFYLGRPLTGLLMLFSFGGGLLWWFVDLFLVRRMLREHSQEQEHRQKVGLPPLELSFMPPLWRNVLEQPPDWTQRWEQAGAFVRARRLIADTLVLGIVGFMLGVVARAADVWEGVVAVAVLVLLTAAGAQVGRVGHLPIVRGLIRWNHRLRLFYYYSRPGTSLSLLFRPLIGPFLAPFRQRYRAEVRLYLQLGGIFTLLFLVIDFGEVVLQPLIFERSLPALTVLFRAWISEATLTFIVIFAFATPVGAILTKYLLMRRTHVLTRLLSVAVLLAVALGLLR